MKKIDAKTIVLIHGAFVSYTTWDEWKAYFEKLGYTVFAPAWPYKNASAPELRSKHPDPDLSKLRLRQVIDYYADFIAKLDEKPIAIGHSMGGLITQVLVNRGLVAAGVAIHSVPPLGVIPVEPSFYKAATKSLGLFTSSDKPYLMSLADWQYAFTNGMNPEEQQSSYDRYTVPESKRLSRDGLSTAAKVDFSKPHVPLLMISGTEDNIIPASLNRRNFNRYKKNGSVIELKTFEGRNHYTVGQNNWREVADYIQSWITGA